MISDASGTAFPEQIERFISNRLDAADAQDEDLMARLGTFRDAAQTRVVALREQLTTAQGFADTLPEHHQRLTAVRPPSPTRIG